MNTKIQDRIDSSIKPTLTVRFIFIWLMRLCGIFEHNKPPK